MAKKKATRKNKALSELEVALNGLDKDFKKVESFKTMMRQLQE